MKKLLFLFFILIFGIFSLGCINLGKPVSNYANSESKSTNAPAIYYSNLPYVNSFTSDHLSQENARFIGYYVSSREIPVDSISLYPIPLSTEEAQKFYRDNWPKDKPLTFFFALKFNINEIPKIDGKDYLSTSIKCDLHRKCIIGCEDTVNPLATIQCDYYSCDNAQPTIVSDIIETTGKKEILALYYLDCKIKNAYFYRYWIVGKAKSLEKYKQRPELNTIIVSTIEKAIGTSDFPTGIGPLQFQIYTYPDYTAELYGLDKNAYVVIPEDKSRKNINIYLRVANLLEENSFWGINVTDPSDTHIIDLYQAYTGTYVANLPFDIFISSDLSYFFDCLYKKYGVVVSGTPCLYGVCLKLDSKNSQEYYAVCQDIFNDENCLDDKILEANDTVKSTNGKFVTLEQIPATIELNNNCNAAIIGLVGKYSYRFKAPLLLVRVFIKQ